MTHCTDLTTRLRQYEWVRLRAAIIDITKPCVDSHRGLITIKGRQLITIIITFIETKLHIKIAKIVIFTCMLTRKNNLRI